MLRFAAVILVEAQNVLEAGNDSFFAGRTTGDFERCNFNAQRL
jgi:hypothetical protein